MKKFLLTLIVTMLAFVGTWAQGTQASQSVYKFTSTAQDNLYTYDGENYIKATTTEGAVCGQNYFVKSDYAPATAPETEVSKAISSKSYYEKDGDNYTCAWWQTYDEAKTYANVNEVVQITDANKDDYVGTVGKFTQSASTGVQTAKWVDDFGGYWDGTGEYVNEGDICEDETRYKISSGVVTGAELKGAGYSWTGFVSVESAFASVSNIYTLDNDIYTQITSTDYDPAKTYYAVTFTVLDDAAEAAMAANEENFSTSWVVKSLTESLFTTTDGITFNEVHVGDVYAGENAYYKAEESYMEKTPEQLVALGYVNAETTLYMCDVEKAGNTVTISYDSSRSYGSATKTLIDFIKECPSEISGYENVVIKSTDANHASVDNVKSIVTGINNVTGITNLVLDEMANNGMQEYDFTGLTNTQVKRVILPTTGANIPDFSDIKTILNTIASKNSTVDPVVIEVVAHNGYADTKDICFVYSPEKGSLYDIRNSHYYSTNISNCTRQEYSGFVGGSDYVWFNGVSTQQLDMSGLKFANDDDLAELKETIHNLDNDVIEYLALPMFDALPVEPLYKDLRAYCSSLIAVGQFVMDGSHKVNEEDVADGSLNVYSKVPGKVGIITNMLDDLTAKNALIYRAKISGNLNADDISNGNTYITAEGHAFTQHVKRTTTTADLEDDADQTNAGAPIGALTGATITSINLEHAVFPVQTDMNLAKTCGGRQLKNVVLPTSPEMTLICNGCLATQGITEICIPNNFKIIGEGAFRDNNPMHHITTTDAEGNLIDNGDYTMTLPAQLEHVKTGAFFLDELFLDVYVLATTTPLCDKDAFGAGTYFGWGGFNSTPPITRDSYGRTGEKTFAILHFPSNTTVENVKKYVDDTRVYSIPDGLQTTDANGKLIYWPSQEDYNHYENDAVYGYIWNDLEGNISSSELTHGDAGTKPAESKLTEAGISVKDGAVGYNYDYAGWHQFVLIYASNGIEEKPKWDFSNIYDNNWWTICVPFDMTKSDLINVFGTSAQVAKDPVLYTETDVNAWVDAQNAPHQVRDAEGNQPGTAGYTATYPSDYTPKTASDCPFQVNDVKVPGQAARDKLEPVLCTLETVTRNSETETITFKFGQDLVNGKADDAVVLEAGKAYMIKPNMPNEFVSSSFMPGSHVVEYSPKFEDKTAYPLYNTTISAIDQNGADTQVKYDFVGTYVPQKMPAHSFFLGWDENNAVSHVAYYHQKAESKKESWKAYTAIIVPEMTTTEHYTVTTGTSTVLDYYTVTSGNDDFASGTAARAITKFVDDEDNEITRINGMSVESMRTSNVVYNLNGQVVNANGNLEGLNKGIYIVNGRKFIVK